MKEQQKKKAAPVLVVLILIVLVGAAGIVSFLINRYKPGTEYMAGNEYFNLTDENSVALIQNGELLEEQASKKEKPSASPGSRAVEKVPCCERSCG